jgi:hypothetical protein
MKTRRSDVTWDRNLVRVEYLDDAGTPYYCSFDHLPLLRGPKGVRPDSARHRPDPAEGLAEALVGVLVGAFQLGCWVGARWPAVARPDDPDRGQAGPRRESGLSLGRPAMSFGAERRKWQRLPTDPRTRCDLLIDGAVDFRAVAVRNIAEGGVQLLLDVPVAAGLTLWVQLHNPAGQPYCLRRLAVVYRLPWTEATYVLGGAFTRELSHLEVEGLREGPGGCLTS